MHILIINIVHVIDKKFSNSMFKKNMASEWCVKIFFYAYIYIFLKNISEKIQD